jgi:FMN phosphatase YigB (HAD superfamily)
MTIRAVIFDIYKTILEVSPPPANIPELCDRLWQKYFSSAPRMPLGEFAQHTDALIATEHASANSQGINCPEVNWPEIASQALPELCLLGHVRRDEFLFEHAQLRHYIRLMDDAADALRSLAAKRIPLGIASNAQRYTLRELEIALAGAKLGMHMFVPDLCFWSFQAGFSKPDPHVFRLLGARLSSLNMTPAEALMVGDRLDNDIHPAQAQGWQVWQLSEEEQPAGIPGGPWRSLAAFLKGRVES